MANSQMILMVLGAVIPSMWLGGWLSIPKTLEFGFFWSFSYLAIVLVSLFIGGVLRYHFGS